MNQTYNINNNTIKERQKLPPIKSLLPYTQHKSLEIPCCDKPNLKKKKSRSNLPKHVTNILNEWLSNHLDNPYPTAVEKKELIAKTNLSSVQLSNWFINVRRRKLFAQYYDLKDKPIAQKDSVLKSAEDKKQLELEYMHTKKRMSLETILNVSCSDDESAKNLKKNNKPVKEVPDEKPKIIIEADEIKLEEKFNFQPFVKRKKLMDRLYDLKKIYYVNDSDATGEQS